VGDHHDQAGARQRALEQVRQLRVAELHLVVQCSA
jgi:hypothetical protein